MIAEIVMFDLPRGINRAVVLGLYRQSAARWHGSEYRSMIRSRYGSEPRIHVLNAERRVDAISAKTVDL